MLHPVLDPAHRDAEVLRGEPHQDDVDVDGGLDLEAAAESGGVIRRSFEPGRPSAAAATEWERERPLEVRPRGQRPPAAFQSATTP